MKYDLCEYVRMGEWENGCCIYDCKKFCEIKLNRAALSILQRAVKGQSSFSESENDTIAKLIELGILKK